MEIKLRILASATAIMVFNSVYQYSWNVFAVYLTKYYNVDLMYTELMFLVFVLMSTLFQIAGGFVADNYGPRKIGILAAFLSASGYLSFLRDVGLALRIALWGLGSAGEGILYGIATNAALKWHRNNRGLAVGLVSFGFGAGATIFNPLFLAVKSLQTIGITMFAAEALVLPPLVLNVSYPAGLRGVKPKEAVLSKIFLIIYISYALGTVPLLSLSSSMFALKNVSYFYLAAAVFPLMSGLGRPVMGRISDSFGRLRTMIASFVLITASAALGALGVPLIPEIVIGFLGGAMIPLYFSLVGDYLGEAYSTSITSVLYTGKTVGGVLGSVVIGYVSGIGTLYSWALMGASSAITLVLVVLLNRILSKHITRSDSS
ncbi:MAG: MFS transporter [Nitrososphaeria archaeon]